jgi:hypothetical protein
MVYGSDAVIPVEIGHPSWRIMYPTQENEQLLREDSDMVEEVREAARIKELSRKQQVAQRYNLRVVPRSFQTGDLVLRRASIGNRNAKDGKLQANWEGPFRIKSVAANATYHLETLKGKEIPRTLNVVDLRRYYS